MQNNDRGFFGIIIPAEILSNDELNITEKFVFGFIASFRRCCFMSNEAIAAKIGVSESTVKHVIPKLEKLGYIFVEKENNNNNKRKLYSVLDNPKKLAYLVAKGMWKSQSVVQNMHDVVQNMHDDLTGVRSAKYAHIDKEENIEESETVQKPNYKDASGIGSLEAMPTARPRRKDYANDEEWEKAFYKWNSTSGAGKQL